MISVRSTQSMQPTTRFDERFPAAAIEQAAIEHKIRLSTEQRSTTLVAMDRSMAWDNGMTRRLTLRATSGAWIRKRLVWSFNAALRFEHLLSKGKRS